MLQQVYYRGWDGDIPGMTTLVIGKSSSLGPITGNDCVSLKDLKNIIQGNFKVRFLKLLKHC